VVTDTEAIVSILDYEDAWAYAGNIDVEVEAVGPPKGMGLWKVPISEVKKWDKESSLLESVGSAVAFKENYLYFCFEENGENRVYKIPLEKIGNLRKEV
jgi:hypothetical protein